MSNIHFYNMVFTPDDDPSVGFEYSILGDDTYPSDDAIVISEILAQSGKDYLDITEIEHVCELTAKAIKANALEEEVIIDPRRVAIVQAIETMSGVAGLSGHYVYSACGKHLAPRYTENKQILDLVAAAIEDYAWEEAFC